MTRIACLLMTNDLPAHAALLQVALAHSPRVEDAGAGCLYLDASGLQSLFGDEIFTYAIVKPGFGHVFSGIHAYERNPPLFFFLAAAAAKLGDPTVWTRMPSLLLGTATIPLTYDCVRNP